MVHSDGKTASLAAEPGILHPSIYKRDPESGIDEKEFFHWDLCGHLVLRGVMDADWLAAANEAIDTNADRISTGGSAAGDSKPLAGTGVGRSSMGNPWELPAPYGRTVPKDDCPARPDSTLELDHGQRVRVYDVQRVLVRERVIWALPAR